jgi:hypothetical protein
METQRFFIQTEYNLICVTSVAICGSRKSRIPRLLFGRAFPAFARKPQNLRFQKKAAIAKLHVFDN